MAVRAKNGRWVVEFMQRGIRVFRRLPPGRTKADAKQLEAHLRGQIFDAVDLGKLPDPLLSKVIDEWLEEKVSGRKSETATRSHAGIVRELAQGAYLSGCQSIADRIRAGGQAPATRNRRLCILKAAAKYAYQKGYTQENLSPKIQLLPENNARHLYLLPLQVGALLKSAQSAEVRAFIAWAVYTGMRQGEIMALGAEDILDGAITIKDSKTGSPRLIPIIRELRPYLSAIPFKSHKRTLYAGFEAARDKAGLSGLRYHDLRHTTASQLINSGAELFTVGEILGHKSTQTTKRYAHLSVERKRSALEAAFGKPDKRTKKAV